MSGAVPPVTAVAATLWFLTLTGCSLAAIAGGGTAEVTRLRLESVLVDLGERHHTSTLMLEGHRIGRVKGMDPETGEVTVPADGAHSSAWLSSLERSGVVTGICPDAGPSDCSPGRGRVLITISDPIEDNGRVSVDAILRGVEVGSFGQMRYTRYVRLRLEEGRSGWRVIAETPLWETTGSP